ncbi:hypothetical protein BH24GEM1_BH24GEM1_25690 [soil metagenome]
MHAHVAPKGVQTRDAAARRMTDSPARSPDGTTFVMVRRSPAARIIVIQNLPALVRRLRGERAGTQ